MRSLKCVAAILIAIGTAVSSYAGRTFTLSHEKQPVRDGEVCFYRTASDVSGLHPSTFYFHDREVRCQPTDTLLEFPAGRFLFFARHARGLVSAHRGLLYFEEPSLSDCEARSGMPVVSGATLDLSPLLASLSPGEYAGVWVADTQHTVSTFIPSVPGETKMLVPARVPIVPLLISGRQPRRIGNRLVLEPGETRRVSFNMPERTGDVVVWFDAARPNAPGTALPPQAPSISLTSAASSTHTPLEAPRHPASLAASLLLFKDVPPGEATIEVNGEYWTNDALQVRVVPGQVVVASRGLRTAPAGAVNVALPVWLSHRAANARSMCEIADDAVAVEAVRCATADDCKVIARAPVDASSTVVRFGGLPAGEYNFRVDPPHIGGKGRVDIVPVSDATVALESSETIVQGVVRRGTKPARAWVMFATDDGAASDENGKYYIPLRADPGALPVMLRLCDSEVDAVYIPEEPPRADRSFDIVIPDNSLRVAVHDASTGKPVANARVTYSSPPAADGSTSFAMVRLTGERGETTFQSVVAERPLTLCVTAPQYARYCSEPFRLASSGEETKRVSLVAAEKRGRVRAPAPLEGGRIYLVNARGDSVFTAPLASDGSFGYSTSQPSLSAVVVAASLPLTVVPRVFPPDEGADLVIDIPPAARVGRFSVALAPDSDRKGGRVGLTIDDVNIPSTAFTLHQSLRQEQSVVMPHRAVVVRDVAWNGEVRVRLGADPADTSVPPDAVSRPEYSGVFPQKSLAPGQTEIIFP